MFTINQLYELSENYLDDTYHSLIPNTCKYCGYPIIINRERTIMRCSNNCCPQHLAHRADLMLKQMNIKGIGAGIAYQLISENNLTCHVDILGLTLEQMPSKNSLEVRKKYWTALQRGREQTLGKVLRFYQLDEIADQKADQITEGFSSFKELFDAFPTGPELLQHLKKSYKQQTLTETLGKNTYHLLRAKEELMRIEKYFKIVKLVSNKLRVCITGEVVSVYSDYLPMKPRENFFVLLNKKYEGIVSFVNGMGNVSQADVLVTDSTRKTGKYKDALDLQARGKPISILSFSEFADYLEHQYGQGNEEIKIIRRS